MSHHESAARGPDSRLVDRMLFFSDAVFAIVLTLLVLELRPPVTPHGDEAALQGALLGEFRQFFAFGFSFLIVGVFWSAHMRLTRQLIAHDGLTQAVNLAFLFVIALVPFGSALLGEHIETQTAYAIYGGLMVAASIGQTLLWVVIARDGGRLIGGVEWRTYAYQLLRCMGVGIVFAAVLGLMAAGRMDLARWAPLAIVPLIMILRRLVAPKENPTPPRQAPRA